MNGKLIEMVSPNGKATIKVQSHAVKDMQNKGYKVKLAEVKK